MNDRICAIVVTRNRKDTLRECLDALNAQLRKPDHIVVVDNASTDGTSEMLEDEFSEVELLRLSRNEGGAGGFYWGIRNGYEQDFDLLWIMDDDTIPKVDALAELEYAHMAIREIVGLPLLLSSRVEWVDGTVHPMNFPTINFADQDLLVKLVEIGYLPIRSASFVSLLLHRQAIDKYGLPVKDYFIWNDDVEYTARILRNELGFLVPKSVVIHKTKEKYIPISVSSPERYYYEVRNKIWMLSRSNAWTRKEKIKYGIRMVFDIGKFVRNKKFSPKAIFHIVRGVKDGIFHTPASN